MSLSEYYKIYRETILPNLDLLDKKRKQKCRNLLILGCSSAILPIIGFFAIQTHSSVIVVIGLLLIVYGFIAILSAFPYYFSYKKIYSLELKKEILPELLKSFGEINYCPNEKTLFEAEILKSGLFQRNRNFMFDDKFKGTYKNVNFEILETISPFRGLVISFELDKLVKNRTVIVSKRALFQKNSDVILFWIPLIAFTALIIAVSGGLTPIKILEYILFVGLYICFWGVIYFLGSPFNSEPLNKISLEDIKFAKKFNIYSSDEVEARYLINPAFMERLLNLKMTFKSKNIRTAFYNNKLIIAIASQKDFFEIGKLNTSLKNMKCINEFYNELSSILNMIEYFKLNTY